jgi:hypothetical protein
MSVALRIGAGVHARRFGDEVVVIDVRRGVYFSLNEVGSFVWQEVVAGASLDAVVAAVVAAFAVADTTARNDVEALVEELVAARLVERSSGAL